MKVLLDDRLFQSQQPDQVRLLDRILHLAGTFRHRLSIRSAGRNDVPWTKSAFFTNWLQARDRFNRDTWTSELNSGLDRLRRSSCQIIVSHGPTNWALEVPVLSTEDAVSLCSRPAKLVVENRRNDPKLLLAFARPDQRDLWERSLKSGALAVEGPGGLPELLAHAATLASNHDESFRAVFICDSDALAPGRPGPDALQLRAARAPFYGAPWRVGRGFVLTRRCAESYLPLSTLARSADSLGKEASARRRSQVSALGHPYFAAFPDRRFHYNMKKGFSGDINHDRRDERGELYDFATMPADILAVLCCGLGERIREAFDHGVSEAEARADGSLDEMRQLIGAVLAMVE